MFPVANNTVVPSSLFYFFGSFKILLFLTNLLTTHNRLQKFGI